jgi:hypothetical protein
MMLSGALKVPHWLGQVFDLDLSEHFTTLIRVSAEGGLEFLTALARLEEMAKATRRTATR